MFTGRAAIERWSELGASSAGLYKNLRLVSVWHQLDVTLASKLMPASSAPDRSSLVTSLASPLAQHPLPL